MSTLPLSGLKHSHVKAGFPHKQLAVALVCAFLFSVFVYSGLAWIWFKPVLHKSVIDRYAAAYRFDPLWVMAIIKVESGFYPHARSNRGAVGLMQLLPSTARDIAPELGLKTFQPDDLRNPETNLKLGIYYLSKLQDMFPDDEVAVLSAYNAGPGITRQWRAGNPVLDISDIQYGETKRFVREVERTFGYLKMIQGWKHLFGIYGH
jgi:soluble lytic murein transglycosylase